jgi:hypothetical protein
MEISKPDDLGDIANLGLTLTEAKQLLARAQREISAAQAREHAGRRPVCRCRDGICRVKDYRDHAVATLFAQVALRLPLFRCAACGRIETGINWPSHCRSIPELDRLRAHMSALMTYRVSAGLLEPSEETWSCGNLRHSSVFSIACLNQPQHPPHRKFLQPVANPTGRTY